MKIETEEKSVWIKKGNRIVHVYFSDYDLAVTAWEPTNKDICMVGFAGENNQKMIVQSTDKI